MRLVPDWRSAWRWFSVQALAILAVLPMVWLNLPPDLKSYIPKEWGLAIVCLVAVAGIAGRVIDQNKPAA
jgi:di/tricarboxylate transporter